MSTDLRTVMTEQLDPLDLPPGDLGRALQEGRSRKRKRRVVTGVAVGGALAVAASAGIALLPGDDGPGAGVDPTRYASLGALDLSEGARAYADPGYEIHLGGRTFPAGDLAWLDTDAVVTQHGVVFFDAGRPMLLEPSGSFTELQPDAVEAPEAFHPAAKADAAGALVAWATWRDGVATMTVRDLATGAEVGSTDVECGRCGDLVIDGIDGGVVFVRDGDGTRTWDSRTGEWADFAGPETRVADVRNGVVLYDGPAPTDPGDWRLVAGAVDAQLTFDGGHVLSWSSTLRPTMPDGEKIVLEQGPAAGGYGFWTIDTDGSVLVAAPGKRGQPEFTVFDCELPSGACAAVGPLEARGGDPEFIGNDM